MSEIETAFSATVGPRAGAADIEGWQTLGVVLRRRRQRGRRAMGKIAVFGDTAEALSKTLQKGDRICEGRLTASVWTPDSGPPRVQLDIAAWKCERLNQIGRNRPKEREAHS